MVLITGILLREARVSALWCRRIPAGDVQGGAIPAPSIPGILACRAARCCGVGRHGWG
jgi:hypothetical protein